MAETFTNFPGKNIHTVSMMDLLMHSIYNGL